MLSAWVSRSVLEISRLIMVLKLVSLSRGYSGVRPEVIEHFISMVSNDILPVIPEKGSVGASGDLAPLAHLSLALIGEGEVFFRGKRVSAAEALQSAELDPLVLKAKEGLALLNGTQVSAALAIEGLFSAEQNLASAIVIGAISVDAALGSYVPFDARIHEARGQSGQTRVAAIYRALLNDSELNRSHADCDRVQIRTAFAVSRRCWAPVSISSIMRHGFFCAKQTPFPITRFCVQKRVMSYRAETSTRNLWRWLPTILLSRLPRPAVCLSDGSPCWSMPVSVNCRPFSAEMPGWNRAS